MADDIQNPGGYRQDDPRYGLTGAALKSYYNSRTPQFYIRCMYKAASMDVRAAAMDEHLAYIRAHAGDIWFAGPLLSDDGATPIGTIFVIDAPDAEAAEAFIAAEGYHRAGLFDSVEIRRFASSMEFRQGARAPDPALQMFVCECIDGPQGAEKRKATGAAHHAYQATVMDRFVCRGPFRSDDGEATTGSLFIIEVADRDAAEKFIAAEPMTAAGTFEPVRITRWRYGKSLTS